MNQFLRFGVFAILATMLVACGTAFTKSEKLQANAAPIRNLDIVVWMGNFAHTEVPDDVQNWYAHPFRDALSKRMPDIFKVNGVPVKLTVISNAKQKADSWPKMNVDFSGVSHVLVLTTESYAVFQGNDAFYFSACLWDAQTKQVVWKATPQTGAVIKQPLLRAQVLAGAILNGLNKDGLITLKTDGAVDLSGKAITNGYYIGTEDR